MDTVPLIVFVYGAFVGAALTLVVLGLAVAIARHGRMVRSVQRERTGGYLAVTAPGHGAADA